MSNSNFSNRMSTGMLVGLILPIIVFIIVYLFSSDGQSFGSYLDRVGGRNLITHFISLCVFPNVFAFLIFNRFDKLQSSRGVLGITIIWAIVVFIIKML